jgi:predicted murein hydrolase (TIGR00659 family)
MSATMRDPFSLWSYLAATPLLWLTATLAAWLVADRLAAAAGRHPLANPVLIAVVLVALLLATTNTDYAVYFEGAQFVHFLLGPATVALALPLFRHRRRVLRSIGPITVALLIGSVTAVVSAVAIAVALGVPRDAVISLAPKSVTAAIAMGISESQGGDPALTAALVIVTGILGAIIVTPLMNLFRIRDFAARGFAVGLASHGIGTARAFSVNPLAGTFAGIAMGLNAIVTALLVPSLLVLLGLV